MAQGLFNLKQVTQAIQQKGWVNQKPAWVDFLVVAGGGGAGASSPGGGGAGGVLVGSASVVSGSAITVTVGAGGGGTSSTTAPTSGSNSVFGSVTATGGGQGGNNGIKGGDGGSGGGSTATATGGQGTINQGFGGGTAYVSGGGGSSGGGGGAGGVGQTPRQYNVAGQGGNGLGSVITGTMTGYGGGGDGSYGNVGSGYSAAGTPYGGGGIAPGGNGGDGTVNTGGGGGAGPGYTGGTGGSGIVVISYPDTFAAPTATTGSPTVSTSGSGSIVFDGSDDYVRYPTSTNYAFSTGDFTVEAFIYRSNLNGMILDARSTAVSEPWCFYLSSADLAWINGSSNPSTSTTVPSGSWVHVAACRSGTTLKLFINGVAGYTGTDTTNYTTTSPLLVGINANLSSNPFSGYISNVRITKGTAVYTADFTPPTAPLTKLTNTGFLLNTVSGAVFADSAANAVTNGTGGQVAWNSTSPFTVTGYKNRVYKWTSSGSITF